jgi:Domain of unknown function (DUF6484)
MSTLERDIVSDFINRALEEVKGADLGDSAVEPAPNPAPTTLSLGLIRGKLIALHGDTRTPLVLYRGQQVSTALVACTLVDLSANDIGREVMLMPEEGDLAKPVIVGLLREDLRPGQRRSLEVDMDGERLVVSADRQIAIRCGKASITLTKAGKVLIEGEYVISRARRTNRVEGAAVQIN